MSQLVKNVGSVTTPLLLEQKTIQSPLCYAATRFKIVNADGFGDYFSGLKPDYALKEDYVGCPWKSEPLLSTAIGKLQEQAKCQASPTKLNYFTDAKSINGVQNQMYIDKAPQGILKALNQ
jgi:hypothetical protein